MRLIKLFAPSRVGGNRPSAGSHGDRNHEATGTPTVRAGRASLRDNGGMSILTTARFADTVAKLPQLDRANPHGLPEVAFVGRSNAGKSSCINTLCNQKRLAFSSRTPGRTQAARRAARRP